MHTPAAMFAALASVLVLALVSAPHCAAMCGPLASCVDSGPRYHLGRLLGYGGLGAALGWTGGIAVGSLTPWPAAIAAWMAAIVLATAARAAWIRGTSRLVPAGAAPRGHRRSAPRLLATIRERPVVCGGLTALLPCGALWAALAISLTAGSALGGLIVMAAFAALTGVSISVATLFLAGLRGRLGARPLAIVFALAALAFALIPLPAVVGSLSSGPMSIPACPLHSTAS